MYGFELGNMKVIGVEVPKDQLKMVSGHMWCK